MMRAATQPPSVESVRQVAQDVQAAVWGEISTRVLRAGSPGPVGGALGGRGDRARRGPVQYTRTRGLNANGKDHPLRQVQPKNRGSESSLRVKPFGSAQGRLRNLT